MSQEIEQIMQQFKACIPLLDVLRDENRQAIILLLAQHKSGLNVNAIADRINLSRPAISHHLKVLKQSGFVSYEKKNVENYYAVTLRQPLEQLKSLIAAVEAQCTSS
ncbi:winged helix-turn-helix transcriptional regulator [Paenibacillus lycopersici]|uniref:Winged helix-turn-helix transcriptional regulator n=1 Tax=Paenibacillus lycopersici TaxID=2704462 RepID=A0A6C0G1Q4_9BACL|nr:metalloregulator ArsR/SmtB family transcription factor [Paenibacillus lycopersici]QHT58595.1 winged helix-turn-helix transcriptional regulator [Paenibacillus lycopersici]